MVIFKWDELPESVRWVRVSDNKRVIVALQEKDDVGEGWTWHERPKSEESEEKRPDYRKKDVKPTNRQVEIPVWIYRLNDGSGFIVKEEPVTEIGTFTLFARKFINVTEGEGL